MSYHSRNTDSLNATLKTLMKRGAHVGLGIGAFTPILALANPTGGQVAAGSATIGVSGNTTTIKQSSSAAIINWQQFNIGASEYVKFLQPSSSSVILNRVVGSGLSGIYGNLTANGQVFLVNPNGVFFGKGSMLDAQGFVASTLNISDNNFMAGHYAFQKGSAAPDATIVNQGNITAHNGGYVVLAGDYAENDGLIAAPSGHVVLASGARATLGLSGNSLVNFAVTQATLAQYAGALNAGSLIADGGTVIMTADVANQLRAAVVNNTGLVEAHGINKTAGGIFLTAAGGGLTNAGTLDANAVTNFTQGGKVVLTTDQLLDLTSTSKITARGDGVRGGSIQFHGENAKFGGTYKVGRGGTILLDPASINFKTGTTGTATNTIGTATVKGELSSGTNVAVSASTHIGHTGSATGITAGGTGNLTLKIGSGGTIQLFGFDINIGGHFFTQVLSGGNANESFGHIQAKSVGLKAGTGTVNLTGASGSLKSIKTTGTGSGTSGNVSISAGHLTATGDLSISAARDINLNASIGSAHGVGAAFAHNVFLHAGSVVNVHRSIYAGANTGSSGSSKAIHITGGFVNIGSASRRVTLDAGGSIDLTAGENLNMTTAFSGESLNAGLDAGASHRDLTLTATSGQVKVQARGQTETSLNSGVDAERHTINLTAGHDIIISAHSDVTLQGGHAVASASAGLSNGSISVFDNVNLLASHDIKITSVTGNVHLTGGSDKVHLSSGDKNLTLTAQGKVFLNASHSIDITASNGSVDFNAGKAIVEGGTGSFSNNTAHANGFVSLAAKATINISGKDGVNVQGGSIDLVGTGSGHAKANGVTHLTANVGVYIGSSAATAVDITASNGSIFIRGGKIIAQGGGGSSAASFNENFLAGASFTAKAGGVTLDAKHDITIHGGSNTSLTMAGSGAGHAHGWTGVDLTTTNNGDISLTAGLGSIVLSNGINNTVSGAASNQTASLDAAVRVNTSHNLTMSAGGNLTVTAASIGSVHSATFVAGQETSHSRNLSIGDLNATGKVTLTDLSGKVFAGNITAGGAISITAGQFSGASHNSSSAGQGGSVSAGNLQGKSVTITARRGFDGSASTGQLANIHVGNVTATGGSISIQATDLVGNSSFGGGNITVSGNLETSHGGRILVGAAGNGRNAGNLNITGNVITLNAGSAYLVASHTGTSHGGSLNVGGSINAAGNVNVVASHASSGSTGGNITLHDVTGLRINIRATNHATWSGGSIHVNGNLHATGTSTNDGVIVTAHDVGCCSSIGGHIHITGNVTADHGDVTLSATDDNGSNAGITAGAISGRKVKITTSTNGSDNSALHLGVVTAATATLSAAHGGSIVLAAGSSAAPSVKTTAGNIKIVGGNLSTVGSGNLVLDAAKGLQLQASVNSVSNVDLTAHSGSLSVHSIHANNHVHLKDVKGNIVGSGSIVAGHGGVNITASNGSISMSGATIKATGSAENAVIMSATGGDLTAGSISASSQVHLTATGHNVNDHGTITSKLGNITVGAAAINMSSGSLNAAGSVQLTASSGNVHVHNITATNGKVQITDASGNIFGSGSIVATHNDVSVTASNGSIAMGSATLKASGESGTVTLTASGGGIDAGSIHATRSVTLTATGHNVHDSHKITTTNGGVTVNAASLSLSNGTISAGGGVSLTASNGEAGIGKVVAASGDVNIKNVSGGIFGFGNVVASHGDVSITASNGSIGMNGAIKGSGESGTVTITATGGTITAHDIHATSSVTLAAAGHRVTDSGLITAGSKVTITGGSMDLGEGGITASSVALTVTAGNMSAGGISASHITLTGLTGHEFIDHGQVNLHIGNLALTAKSFDLSGGSLFVESGNVSLTASGGDLIAGGIDATAVTLTATGHTIRDASQITAFSGDAVLSATNINLHSGGAQGTKVLLTATGSLDAGRISAASSINLTHTNGDIKLTSAFSAKSVTINAGAHSILFNAAPSSAESAGVIASNNVTLTAKNYDTTSFQNVTISAGGALTVKGAIGAATNSFSGPLALEAGGAIKVDHNVFVDGNLHVEGKSLVFTGKAHTFTMSDAEGIFALDASLGTKLAPVKYNVNLKESFGDLLVQRNIFTGTTAGGHFANITLTETGGGGSEGVIIGGNMGNAVTLSTKGNLTVTGINAGAGAFPGSPSGILGAFIGTVGAVNLNAKNISFTANGALSNGGGHVFLVGGSASVGHGSSNVSVKLNATGNITLGGDQVFIRAGRAVAALSSSAANATAHADVSLTAAAGTVTLTGGNGSAESGVFIEGGSALAGVFSGAGAARSAKATADVTISAKTIKATGNDVEAFGGFADAAANAGKAQTATATANADTLIKSATTITLTAGSAPSHNARVELAGGNSVGSSGSAIASGAKAVAKATATGNLTLSAPGTIAINGNHVEIFGGNSAGRLANAAASGGGVATLTDMANTKITAHTLTIGGSVVDISGGSAAGAEGNAFASAAGAATLTAQAGVSVVSATTLTITATDGINVRGGRGAARGGVHPSPSTGPSILSSGTTGSSGTTFQVLGFHSAQQVHPARAFAKGTGAKATLSATAGVSLTAPGAITLTGGAGVVNVSGGDSAASVARAEASNGGVANLTGSAPVTITTAGALKITGAGVGIRGGRSDGFGAPPSFSFNAASVCFNPGSCSFLGSSLFIEFEAVKAKGTGAQAKLSANGTVSLKGGSVALTATGSSISIAGGRSAGGRASVSASHGGLASVGVKAGVGITAATTFTAKGPNVGVFGGGNLGSSAFVVATGAGAKALFNGDATVAVSAKSVLLSAASSLAVEGGSSVAKRAFAGASLGGSAAMTAKAGLTLKATSGTLTATAVGGDMLIAAGGSDVGKDASVGAFRNGIANLTADDTTLLSGTTGVKFTAGNNLTIAGAGGDDDGSGASASASFGGKATLTDNTVLTISTPKAFTAKAGGQLSIEGANSLGHSAAAQALHKGAVANIVDNGQVNITAATVALSASGTIGVFGGAFAASSASAYANFLGSANINANAAVNITGKSNVSLKLLGTGSGGGIGIGGGISAAWHATASADTHGGKATITGVGDVNIKATAAGAPITITNGAHNSASIFIGGGSHVASSAFAGASFAGSAAVNASANVNITAPGSLTITAGNHGNLAILGGSNAGAFAFEFAGSSGKAVINANAGVNLTAVAGAVNATAGGDVMVAGGAGSESFLSADAVVVASGVGAVADYTAKSGVSISAHTSMTLTAGGALTVAGGDFKDAREFAVSNGAASVNMDASVALKALTTMTISAGTGDVTVRGGDEAGILGNLFFSPSNAIPSIGGDLKGTVNVGTTISAGADVTLKAGGDLTVMAGAGEVMNVGGIRINGGLAVIGDRWQGGTASLSGNDAVSVTAGHNLTLTAGAAGAGDLAVMGLQPNAFLLSFSPSSFLTIANLVAVRGGSSAAVAKVTFDGDATLSAKNDIIVSANGDASIVGGIVNNVRADHTRGNVNLLGSANATLKAGHDVLLKDVTGSLTVVGANANSSGGGQMLVDAHADSGTALVVGSANGLISAGHDILNAASHALGGGVNLEAGGLVFDVAIGAGTHQQAHTTANAGLKAGNNVTLTAHGDLNVLGGLFDSASASAASASTGERIATMQAHAGITAGAAVSLTITGNGFIAAGDGLAAAVSFISVSHMKGSASADVGASIKGGTAVTLSVGGDLLVRGGASAAAKLVVVGGSDKGVANADAEAVIAATAGNVNITAVGAASFLGGSGASGRAIAFGSNVSAVGATLADVQVSAGGTGTLTVNAGSLTAAAGPNVAQAHFNQQILAVFPGAVANADIEGGVTLTGGNVTLKATAGDLDLFGGSTAGSSMHVVGAASASAALTVGAGVKVKSLGNISLTATAGNINIAAGSAAGVFMQVVGSSGAAFATANVDAGVLIDGKNVTIQTTAGNINVFGGGFAGGFMSVTGAFGGSASANVSNNVRIKASAALKLLSSGTITIAAGSLASSPGTPSSAGPRPVLNSSSGAAHATINSSVKLSGGTGVTITPAAATFSSGTVSAGNLFMDGTVDLNAPLTAALVLNHLAPAVKTGATTGFGGLRPIYLMQSDAVITTPAAGATDVTITSSPLTVQLPETSTALDTLQNQSLVKSLLPLFAPLSTLQVPDQVQTAQGQAVSFTPAAGSSASSIGSACLAVLVQDGAADARCLVANH